MVVLSFSMLEEDIVERTNTKCRGFTFVVKLLIIIVT